MYGDMVLDSPMVQCTVYMPVEEQPIDVMCVSGRTYGWASRRNLTLGIIPTDTNDRGMQIGLPRGTDMSSSLTI